MKFHKTKDKIRVCTICVIRDWFSNEQFTNQNFCATRNRYKRVNMFIKFTNIKKKIKEKEGRKNERKQ